MPIDIYDQRILIIDFGSQYTQLIARRVREAGVYCEIHAFDIDDKAIEQFAPNGIILSGGPETVTADMPPAAPQLVFELGVPVLGICYGMQTMARQLGGDVETSTHREFGQAKLNLNAVSKLLSNIIDGTTAEGHDVLDVWMSHGDKVVKVPTEFRITATSENSHIAAMADEDRHFYGLQFHPEVTHTQQGQRIIERFLHDICGCQALWNAEHIVEELITQLKKQIGRHERVILGLSGGVDSSVVAALLHKAIGDQLTCIFVDNGLLRQNEAAQVMKTFAEHMGVNVILADESERFLTALKGISEPEEKRKIIGKIFIDVFQEQAKALGAVKYLAQGTIYPDVIESAKTKTGKAHVIKSHHNVGGLPEKMDLQLVEPLRDLFKDEVRKVGLQLGLPYDMVYRHPFPGPGLAVRVLGEIKPEYLPLLRQADAIFIEELYQAELYHHVNQAFVVFLPVKAVGVKGDARCYDYVVSLRAVTTVDFMTARAADLSYAFLQKVANRIMNEIAGIARVVYDISSKPPATIEWE